MQYSGHSFTRVKRIRGAEVSNLGTFSEPRSERDLISRLELEI